MATSKKDWKMQAWGRSGGKKRMSTLTPEQRKALAKKAADARWKKKQQ